ncbi:hypothetical protein PY257_02655 [Ramlibacter sp. H39-3-26]|uniref:hypothetical protein n=1 Tax=Curvibacter soli TaxID=3031331 RepID=UPI0023DC7B85|nr:hypothetical protein [Ramlibacter sp. H39-3-26]MDF1484092.1 hypothetical protein [Ramlibacter sp. H39-3-26]
MIYVVELPEQGDPRAWFAYDDEDFARKVAASDPLQAWEIHDRLTARDLLDANGAAPDDPAARGRFPAICALADEHGWDTPLYRADHLLGRGVLRVELVSEREALTAALSVRAGGRCIYWSDRDAIGAFEGADPRIAGKAHWRARRALYEQLVALEVLADDN